MPQKINIARKMFFTLEGSQNPITVAVNFFFQFNLIPGNIFYRMSQKWPRTKKSRQPNPPTPTQDGRTSLSPQGYKGGSSFRFWGQHEGCLWVKSIGFKEFKVRQDAGIYEVRYVGEWGCRLWDFSGRTKSAPSLFPLPVLVDLVPWGVRALRSIQPAKKLRQELAQDLVALCGPRGTHGTRLLFLCSSPEEHCPGPHPSLVPFRFG